MSTLVRRRDIRAGEAVYRRCPIHMLEAVDSQAYTVDAMVSTVNADRYNEIVLPSALARRLEAYQRNPVHLWAHDPRQMANVIGKALDVRAVSGGFRARFQYAVDENPQAAMGFKLIAGGYLSAYSVGFYALAWVYADQVEKAAPEIRAELAGMDLTGVDVIFTDVELFEISLCAVPANRESLVVGRAMENTEKETTPVADPTQEKAAAPVRSKMDVIMRDAAARLRRLADSLECSEWYDSDGEDIAETRDGFVKVLEAVKADVLAELAEDLAEGPAEQPALATGEVEASAPEACAKAGPTISQARALSLEDEIEPEMDVSDIEV